MEAIYRHPKIYLIAGKARHGKTTTGSIIKEEYEKMGKKVAMVMYADYIKDYAKSFFGWDGREETKPRELLQQLGTNIIRQKLNKPDLFVNRMVEDIEILSYFFDVIIVHDVRLKIELEKPKSIFSNTVSIEVIRDKFDNGLTETQKNHLTEVDLDDYHNFDYYIHNNGSIDDLRHNTITTVINKEEK